MFLDPKVSAKKYRNKLKYKVIGTKGVVRAVIPRDPGYRPWLSAGDSETSIRKPISVKLP